MADTIKIKEYLMTPGPTPVPEEVLAAGAVPIFHHRTPRFSAILKKVTEGLKTVFKTKNDVYILTSSGTGAMEACVANLVSPGDKVIVVEAGKFGERWTKINKVYGADVIIVKKPYGEEILASDIEKALKENKDAKAVFIQLSETSTGVVYDIESIGKVTAKTNTVLVVDAISGIGAVPFYQDDWGVDVAISASQKGFMVPPGLTFISVSDKAWKLVESSKSPRLYFDLRESRKALQKDTTPWTPAIQLVLELGKALDIILNEGVENIWKRHEWLAVATRSAIKALNLEIFARKPGNVLTSVKVPSNVDGLKLIKTMRDKYGVTIAGGQDALKGAIFRIGHLGFVDRADIIAAISALEATLKDLGYDVKMGSGVKAAEEMLTRDYRP